MLVELASGIRLFHTPANVPFAAVDINQQTETWPLGSPEFENWLDHRAYVSTGKPPSRIAREEALRVLAGKARYEGAQEQVHVRIAGHGGAIYLDLANERRQVVEITPNGWKVIEHAPIRFQRPSGTLSLPEPAQGGSVDDLRPLLNIANEADFRLAVAWLLGALHDSGPYPILSLQGEQGSSKSTAANVARELIDPIKPALRSKPRDEHELWISASNVWIVAFDNLSGMKAEFSDSLCRLATGGGFSARELYTNNREILFDAKRPIILTGIDALATRGDLADRAIVLTLPPIPEDQRQPEEKFWRSFHEARPRIMGALLDAAAGALRIMPHLHIAELPRMADFFLWVSAAGEALGWGSTAFLDAYRQNRLDTAQITVDSDAVSVAVYHLVASRRTAWKGTATELLDVLSTIASERGRYGEYWPKAPNALTNRLRRVAPALRAIGIGVNDGVREGHTSTRMIQIEKIIEKTVGTVGKVGNDIRSEPTKQEPSRHADDADDGDDDFQGLRDKGAWAEGWK